MIGVVGAVTGLGEVPAPGLRLASGPSADRARWFWARTIAGSALTVVTVPAPGIVGSPWVAGALVIDAPAMGADPVAPSRRASPYRVFATGWLCPPRLAAHAPAGFTTSPSEPQRL